MIIHKGAYYRFTINIDVFFIFKKVNPTFKKCNKYNEYRELGYLRNFRHCSTSIRDLQLCAGCTVRGCSLIMGWGGSGK